MLGLRRANGADARQAVLAGWEGRTTARPSGHAPRYSARTQRRSPSGALQPRRGVGITEIRKVSSRLRHGGELHPRRQESRLVGPTVGAGVRARFEGLSSNVLRLSVERERHRCPAEQWPGGNVAEHGGAVLPVMAERHHPCCHTHPGAPLGGGKAPRVTRLGPVVTWVGEGAARAQEWAIILFQRNQLVGMARWEVRGGRSTSFAAILPGRAQRLPERW